MDIGAFVRAQRRLLNLTQQQLADQAGVGLNFVYQLESGKQTVQLDCVIAVLQALGHELATAPASADASRLTLPRPRRGAPAAPRTPAKLPWD